MKSFLFFIKFHLTIVGIFTAVFLILLHNRLMEVVMSLGQRMRLGEVRDALREQRTCGNCGHSVGIKWGNTNYCIKVFCKIHGCKVLVISRYPKCKDFFLKERWNHDRRESPSCQSNCLLKDVEAGLEALKDGKQKLTSK